MPRHCFFGFCGGLMCVCEMVSVMPVALDVAHAATSNSFCAIASGIAAPPPKIHLQRGDVVLERLRVREQVHHHRRHVVPVRAAVALDELAPRRRGSQRRWITMVPPAYTAARKLWMRPVTWKNGAVASATVSCVMCFHSAAPATLCRQVACVCMQPFGWPVLPEV